ncbi:protein TIFY 9-like isoform X1 [Zingiber officinale]|uniref:protein TIFY 9-like isoform X1 n=1 Tax=Zingiber officinale TaxID=94328 RepID=UPI001C4CF92D|nr:protein TIFY 9-like isoform X1 [Zingiber officinale]
MARGDTMVEHDFFQIEKLKAASFRAADGKSAARSRIQSVVSRINPQLLRSVIAPGATEMPPEKAALLLSSSSQPPHPVTILNPSIRSVAEISNETAPLTIFYNGSMAVFDLPRDKAETIMKLVETANDGSSSDQRKGGIRLPEELDGELPPMARRKSLQRFIAKRKQSGRLFKTCRLTVAGPYAKEKAVPKR